MLGRGGTPEWGSGGHTLAIRVFPPHEIFLAIRGSAAGRDDGAAGDAATPRPPAQSQDGSQRWARKNQYGMSAAVHTGQKKTLTATTTAR